MENVPVRGLYKYTEWLIFKKKEKTKGHEVRRGRQQVLEDLDSKYDPNILWMHEILKNYTDIYNL